MGKKRGKKSTAKAAPTDKNTKKKARSSEDFMLVDPDSSELPKGSMSWMNPMDEADAAEQQELRNAINSRKPRKETDVALWEFSGADDSEDDFLPKKGKKKKNKSEENVVSDSDIDEGGDIVYEDEAIGGDAWGSRKKYFYGGNPNEQVYKKGKKVPEESDSELEEAELEAKESQKLQLKQLEQMDEADFMDAFGLGEQPESDSNKEKSQKKDAHSDKQSVKLDVASLTKKERLRLFNQENPEFTGIMTDFDQRMEEAAKLSRFLDMIDEGVLPLGPATDYIKVKYPIVLNYCANICCYMMFKASRASLKVHPLTGRLVQYKQLLDQMAPLDERIRPQLLSVEKKVSKCGSADVDKIFAEVKRLVSQEQKKHSQPKTLEEDSIALKKSSSVARKSAKRLRILEPEKSAIEQKAGEDLTADERMAVELYGALRKGKASASEDDDSDSDVPEPSAAALPDKNADDLGDDEEDDGRRAITRQIEKNKGQAPKRSKLQRNPRVKYKVKFQKAKVRRKGAVREVRTETDRYQGEFSGINARVKKGVKLA